MNTNIKSALIGMVLAIPVSLYAIHQQNLNAENSQREWVPHEVITVETTTAESISEPEEIEIAETEESRYYNVPLSEQLQDHIFAECEKKGISPALVLAVIGQESQYDASAVGDGGNSVGLMQVQERWHRERMERLGCTDLQDPYQNITVGVDLLAELYNMNPDIYWVLMAYNGGTDYADGMIGANSYSSYAVEVVSTAEELERSMGDGE